MRSVYIGDHAIDGCASLTPRWFSPVKPACPLGHGASSSSHGISNFIHKSCPEGGCMRCLMLVCIKLRSS